MRSSRGSTISLCVLLAVDEAIPVESVNDSALKEFVVPCRAYNVLAASPSKSNECPLLAQSDIPTVSADVRFWG
jgi:hypothetical protein